MSSPGGGYNILSHVEITVNETKSVVGDGNYIKREANLKVFHDGNEFSVLSPGDTRLRGKDNCWESASNVCL